MSDNVRQCQTLLIPDTLANWPWPRTVNPHYAEVKHASGTWLRSFRAFPEHRQDAFDACDFALLACMAYPRHSQDHIRTVCDLMNVFFVVEEYTDDATPDEAEAVAAMIMDALRDPAKPRPDTESCQAGEIARQFWLRATKTASASSQVQFLATFDAYLQSVVREAEDRQTPRTLQTNTVASYLALRRQTVGCWPSFALLGLATEDLTDAVLEQPLVRALSELATELILAGNDLVSYNKERRDGARHNLVGIVVSSGLAQTPQSAVNWLAAYHATLGQRFYRVYDSIQSFCQPEGDHLTPPEVAALLDYADGMGNWVRANDQWSFESPRYFGHNGAQVQTQRTVELLPGP